MLGWGARRTPLFAPRLVNGSPAPGREPLGLALGCRLQHAVRMDLRRSWPTLGLALLLVLDLVLVVWAVWPTPPNSPAAGGGPAAAATSTASPGVSDSPSAGASAKPSPDAVASPRPLTRLVVAVGETAVWSADVGTCARPGTVHVSDDRGRSWTTRRAEGSVTRIRPDGASTAFVVGGTRRCQLRLWTTTRRRPHLERPAVGRRGVGPLADRRPARAPARWRPGHPVPRSLAGARPGRPRPVGRHGPVR